MPKPGYNEELPTEAPPPYSETPDPISVNSTNSSSEYQRPLPSNSTNSYKPPPPPGRPPRPASLNTPLSSGSSSSNKPHSGSGSGSSSSNVLDIYLNNLQLPFLYPAGYLCSKCKNTGLKKNGGKCMKCWEKFYLNKHAYNPNPSLPFKYPLGVLCEKCENTGYKKKNGLLCKDCWERYGPRNRPNAVQTSFNPFDLFGLTTTTTTTMVPSPYGAVSGPPIKVRPGDPRLGGVLCGRCRGSGIVHFLLDEEMCPVCSGLGRIVNQPNGPPPMPPLPGQFPQQQPYQQPYQQQQPYQHQQQQGYYQSPQQNHYGDYKR